MDMEQRFHEALHYTVQTRFRESSLRLSRLLALLPHVRQLSLMSISHMMDIRNSGTVPFLDLLKEMLEAQNFISPVHSPPPPNSWTSQPRREEEGNGLDCSGDKQTIGRTDFEKSPRTVTMVTKY
jgi:hypothetical protein